MIAHHVGCVVESIEESVKYYEFLNSSVSEIFSIKDQKVDVCFVQMPLKNESYYLELIQPHPDNIRLLEMLENRTSFYHIAFKVDSIEDWLPKLKEDGYLKVGEFYSEAFMNKKCIFLMNPAFHLIELIEF